MDATSPKRKPDKVRPRTLRALVALVALLSNLLLAAPIAAQGRFLPVRLPQDAAMHPNAATEWWYFTGHLRDRSGRTFGFELVTFKLGGLKKLVPLIPFDTAFRLDMAISDEHTSTFHSAVRYLLPARGQVAVSPSSLTLRVQSGDTSMAIATLPGKDLQYRLRGSMTGAALDLTLETARRPLLEGGSGVVPMGAGGYSYYYSLTNLQTSGTLRIGTRQWTVTGLTWMDHQWGNWQWTAIRGWDWMAVQLGNGTSLALSNFAASGLVSKSAAVSFPNGTQLVTAALMAPGPQFWTSPATKTRYPQAWHIQVPAIGLDAQVRSTMPNQEMVDPITLGGGYWEGSCTVTGTLRGKRITGLAYTELVGYGARGAAGF
jgi:predicted secreted hydrolase